MGYGEGKQREGDRKGKRRKGGVTKKGIVGIGELWGWYIERGQLGSHQGDRKGRKREGGKEEERREGGRNSRDVGIERG